MVFGNIMLLIIGGVKLKVRVFIEMFLEMWFFVFKSVVSKVV